MLTNKVLCAHILDSLAISVMMRFNDLLALSPNIDDVRSALDDLMNAKKVTMVRVSSRYGTIYFYTLKDTEFYFDNVQIFW